MRKSEIPVIETKEGVQGFKGPAIVVRRSQRTIGGGPETYIEGIDNDGKIITMEILQERSTRPGKLYQKIAERWKTGRVRSSLGSSAIELSHSELHENGL